MQKGLLFLGSVFAFLFESYAQTDSLLLRNGNLIVVK